MYVNGRLLYLILLLLYLIHTVNKGECNLIGKRGTVIGHNN